jgi:hypothetical protein
MTMHILYPAHIESNIKVSKDLRLTISTIIASKSHRRTDKCRYKKSRFVDAKNILQAYRALGEMFSQNAPVV